MTTAICNLALLILTYFTTRNVIFSVYFIGEIYLKVHKMRINRKNYDHIVNSMNLLSILIKVGELTLLDSKTEDKCQNKNHHFMFLNTDLCKISA